MPFRPGTALLPLTPIAFEILLALAERDRHGYAILRHVEARTRRRLTLRTGTLYRALARLRADELIQAITATGDDEDVRRRRYRLTSLGRRIAHAEAERLADQVAAARACRILPGPRGHRESF